MEAASVVGGAGPAAGGFTLTRAWIISAVMAFMSPLFGIILLYVTYTADQELKKGNVAGAQSKAKIVYVIAGVCWGLIALAGLGVVMIQIIEML